MDAADDVEVPHLNFLAAAATDVNVADATAADVDAVDEDDAEVPELNKLQQMRAMPIQMKLQFPI